MSNKICITSGGTGGHIIPARTLASHLVLEGFEVIFCGDKKYHAYIKENDEFQSKMIISSQIKKSFYHLIKAAIKIGLGTIQSLAILTINRPKYVIGFGGYATFPLLIAALITKRKIILHEQNAHLGKVNRIFAKYAFKIVTSFEETSGINQNFKQKTTFIGNLIRPEILALNKVDYVLPVNKEPEIRTDNKMGYNVILKSDFDYNLENKELFNILVIGGSGGAKIFSEILPQAFFNLSEELKEQIKVTQQCRRELIEPTFNQYKSYNINIVIDSFFEDMAQLIAKSHIVIARSGSSSIFEFCAAKKPMILVPFANSADDHQQKNAQYIAQNGAAILVKEQEFTINKISEILKNLINNRQILTEMSEKAANLAIPDATKNFAKLIK